MDSRALLCLILAALAMVRRRYRGNGITEIWTVCRAYPARALRHVFLKAKQPTNRVLDLLLKSLIDKASDKVSFYGLRGIGRTSILNLARRKQNRPI